jgi:hypothetical protein
MIFDVIKKGIKNKFEKLAKENTDLQSLLKKLGSISANDLIAVLENVSPKFPSNYNIFEFYE